MEYVVRRADVERDADAIVAVWARNLKSHDEAQHRRKFDWYYRHNPLGPGKCWLLEPAGGGAPVGTAGLGLRRVRLRDGTTRLAGLASDFAVDAEHRSLRPAMLLARSVAATAGREVDFIYGLPNSRSAGVFRRIGYVLDATLMRYVKVLRSERFLRTRLKSSLVRRPLALVADVATRTASPETWSRRRGAVLDELDRFDERFDALWPRVAAAGGGGGAERTAAFLNWRYVHCPLHRYSRLALFSDARRSDLLGYAVCVLQEDEQAAVIDLLADPRLAVDDLLAEVVRWARRRGAASVACELHGAPATEAALSRLKFKYRGETTSLAILSPPTANNAPAPPPQWSFLRVDEDYN
jgi:hypothetical protein